MKNSSTKDLATFQTNSDNVTLLNDLLKKNIKGGAVRKGGIGSCPPPWG